MIDGRPGAKCMKMYTFNVCCIFIKTTMALYGGGVTREAAQRNCSKKLFGTQRNLEFYKTIQEPVYAKSFILLLFTKKHNINYLRVLKFIQIILFCNLRINPKK